MLRVLNLAKLVLVTKFTKLSTLKVYYLANEWGPFAGFCFSVGLLIMS